MKPKRRFNTNERVALYLAADGKCANCGADLSQGWHADHIVPYSRGGPTDVINGQALCPTCNIKKGNRMSNTDGLRKWQLEAHNEFFSRNPRDYLISATPGAGKTRCSLTLVKKLIDRGEVRRVAIVVPTDALRKQWADSAQEVGLALMPVGTIDDYDKPGYNGCVVTYAQLTRGGVGADLLRRTTRFTTAAILDEIHHAGESRAWGDGLRYALEHATYRIALTGTPWRRDSSSPIPFVTYGPDGKVRVDYAYEYGAAVADGVCRRIEFHAYDGEARWIDCGKVSTAELGNDLADEDVSAALDAVLDPKHAWMPELLRQAAAALDEIREEVPDAGGLVVAERQWMAEAYARMLRDITGEEATLAVSDDPEAKNNIDRFRHARSRWLVAVRMVSEGVDIPRLAVGVYAAKARTPLFFRQVVGRFVRIRPGEEFNSRLFIPAVPVLMKHAREIEEELRHQLTLETERDQKARQKAASQQLTFELREPVGASAAVFDRAIFSGDEVTPAEIEDAAAWCKRHGIPAIYAVNVARARRAEGYTESHKIADVAITPTPPSEPRYRHERMLRSEVDALVGKVAYRLGNRSKKKEVNAELLRRGFPPRARATIEELEQIREYLIKWLGQL